MLSLQSLSAVEKLRTRLVSRLQERTHLSFHFQRPPKVETLILVRGWRGVLANSSSILQECVDLEVVC